MKPGPLVRITSIAAAAFLCAGLASSPSAAQVWPRSTLPNGPQAPVEAGIDALEVVAVGTGAVVGIFALTIATQGTMLVPLVELATGTSAPAGAAAAGGAAANGAAAAAGYAHLATSVLANGAAALVGGLLAGFYYD